MYIHTYVCMLSLYIYTYICTCVYVCIYIYLERERENDFQGFTSAIVRLASLKYVWQAGRLETQVRVDIEVRSLDATRQQAGNLGWVSALLPWHQVAARHLGEWVHIRAQCWSPLHPAVAVARSALVS